MGKSKIIPIVVILAIAGIGIYLLKSGGKVETTGDGISITKTTTKTTTEESFTGSLKAAVQKGVPMKCTMAKNAATGVEVLNGYFHGEKYYGEVVTNGKAGYIIMRDNCMWSWEKETKLGAKMCFEENVWDQQGAETAGNTVGNYNCKVATFSDSIFTVPSDVQFMDIDNLPQE
ncbi:MAG: hypothetical protein WC243_00845 [Patescibacteria group bacterium]|jgi:hypothetical protein